MMEHKAGSRRQSSRLSAFVLVAIASVLGLAGTDLILPAIPSLAAELSGPPSYAQFVLASYVAGVAVGLVAFGELAARVDQSRLLAIGTGAFSILSLLGAAASDLAVLVLLRFFQGAMAAAAPVIAAAWIRSLYGDQHAVRAFGVLASIESLTPALAPVAGIAVVSMAGWPATFLVIGCAGLGTTLAIILLRDRLPKRTSLQRQGSYWSLFTNQQFLRHGVSQACTLGGLLVFVFGLPVAFVNGLGVSITDFVILQVTGIAVFILASNLSGRLVDSIGLEQTVLLGSCLAALSGGIICAYAYAGGTNTIAIAVQFAVMNLGLGLRGPPGFLKAVSASDGNESRASASVLLMTFAIVAIGTGFAAQFVQGGVKELSMIVLGILTLSPALLVLGTRRS